MNYNTPASIEAQKKRIKNRDEEYKNEFDSQRFPSIRYIVETNNRLKHRSNILKDGTIIASGVRSNKESNTNLRLEIQQILNNSRNN